MDLETRSIDFIPEGERYGSPKRLLAIWFSSNLQVTAMFVGALGVIAGLSLPWAILAIVCGNALGAILMAGHAAKGPHLGLPEMVQGRAQFGVLGQSLTLFIPIIIFILFTAANAILLKDVIKSLVPVDDAAAILICQTVTLVIAFFGYEMIQRIGLIMAILSGVVFLSVIYILVSSSAVTFDFSGGAPAGQFWPAIILATTQAASWSAGFAGYSADNARYLPANVSLRSTFLYSFLGQTIGASLIMSVGALAAVALPDLLESPALGVANLFGGWAPVATIIIIAGIIQLNVLNIYGTFMSAMTLFSGINAVGETSLVVKFVIMAASSYAAAGIAILTSNDFGAYFSDVLVSQVYTLFPWCAIALGDFYLVRKGKYAIADLYREDGIYRRYNWATLAIYTLAIAIQIPFVGLNIYKGPIYEMVGVDVSLLPGFLVAGILYVYVFRNKVVSPNEVKMMGMTPSIQQA